MINFIKTPAYETRSRNEDVFDYLCRLGLQLIDPPPQQPGVLDLSANLVLHSPMRRVKEALALSSKTRFVEMHSLREIPFDLAAFVTREEWGKYGSALIRDRFKEAFIKDQFPIKRTTLIEEIKQVLRRCNDEPVGSNIFVVSHSFRLKIIEAFLKTEGRLADNPELIHKYLKAEEQTYKFCHGFSISNNSLPPS